MQKRQGEVDREGEEEYESIMGDRYPEGTADRMSGGQGTENTSKTDSGIRDRDMGRGRMGGGGEITKRDGEENFRSEREHKQRSCAGRVGLVEDESKERYAKTKILEEIIKNGGRKII